MLFELGLLIVFLKNRKKTGKADRGGAGKLASSLRDEGIRAGAAGKSSTTQPR